MHKTMQQRTPVTGPGKLAIDGGSPVRSTPWPTRNLFGEAEKQAAIQVFDESIASGWPFSYQDKYEAAYCKLFTEQLGGGYADAVNSGTNAVYVALRALDLKPYTEVIVPVFSDCGGVMPVPLQNCIPIPCDVAPGSYNMGADQVAQRLTRRTSAIIVAHIGGQPADLQPILDLAQSRGILVLEDCAQSHGAVYRGKQVGTWGDIAAFSTMSSKHHATGAQGGVVYTPREEQYWHARRIADRGKPFNLPDANDNVVASLNFNQNELACAIGLVQLRKLPQTVAARRAIAGAVAEGCRALRGFRVLTDEPQTENSFWFMLVRIDPEQFGCDRRRIAAALTAEGIQVDAGYDPRVCEEGWFKERRIFGEPGLPWTSPAYEGDLNQTFPTPNATATLATHIRINIHEKCGDQEVTDIVETLTKVEGALRR